MLLARAVEIDLKPVAVWLLIIGAVGVVALACFGILLMTRLLRRRDDPRHAKRPPDAP